LDEANCGGCGAADPRFICASGRTCQEGTCCLPTQLVCGTGTAKACCVGTGCCGSSGTCQVTHSNGLGQSYFSCDPLGTHGQLAAKAAANAWLPAGGRDFDPVPDCAGASTCFCRQGATSAATWCYAGLQRGQVGLNTISTGCLCPPQGNASGPWD